jgi:hypothetical protein
MVDAIYHWHSVRFSKTQNMNPKKGYGDKRIDKGNPHTRN